MAETSHLTDLLKRYGTLYGHFKIEACLQKVDSRYELVFAKATAHERSRDKSIQPALDFGDYVYVTQCFDLTALAPILQEQHPTFELGAYRLTLKDATLRLSGSGRMPSNNHLSDWPAELLELRPAAHQNFHNPKSLVAHGTSRLFHDQYDGIFQYMGTRVSTTYNNGWIGAMLFILPDYRIRVRQIVAEGQELTVRTERNGSLIGAQLQCLVDGGEGRQELSESIDESDLTLHLRSSLDQLEIIRLFITHPTDGLIDSYEQVPTSHSGRFRWLAGVRGDNRKEVIGEIGKGEGPHLEFKPFVRIGTGEKKANEVIRAAIAFANAGGGAIMFGVNNIGEIEGIEKALVAATPGVDPLVAAEQYGRQLRTVINDATNRRIELEPAVLEIGNHILLRLNVAELPAREKPVWNIATNEIWIRGGSTNRKPDPDAIRINFAVPWP
jgi:hypothetical protein